MNSDFVFVNLTKNVFIILIDTKTRLNDVVNGHSAILELFILPRLLESGQLHKLLYNHLYLIDLLINICVLFYAFHRLLKNARNVLS